MILLISYDLNGWERPAAYEAVAEVIETHAQDHRRPLYSQWLVLTGIAQNQWLELLTAVTDQDDSIFIVPVRGQEVAAQIDNGIGRWIQAHSA
jgi:hypothetical protein